MDASGRSLIQWPSVNQILRINRIQIDLKGGLYVPPFNLREENALESILYELREPVFGEYPFPSLFHKAAGLTWRISTRHIFWDGNKRTGMAAGMAMLRINQYKVHTTEGEIVNVALRIARARILGYTEEDLVAWFFRHASR